MSLLSFKLRVASGHARLLFADGRAADLEGERLRRLLEVARPLLDHVGKLCDGSLRALSVVFADRVLRATYDGTAGIGVVRIDGDRFDREIVPLCDAVKLAGIIG